jgi:hypothetical protein
MRRIDTPSTNIMMFSLKGPGATKLGLGKHRQRQQQQQQYSPRHTSIVKIPPPCIGSENCAATYWPSHIPLYHII